MENNCIAISRNDLKKSLPDVAYNSVENNFFVFWGAAPGDESQTADYFLSGQKISGSGEVLGEPVAVLKTEDMVLLDVSDPANVRQLSRPDIPGYTWDVTVAGKFAYVVGIERKEPQDKTVKLDILVPIGDASIEVDRSDSRPKA